MDRMIRRDNYESYLVDYAEGNLPTHLLMEMEKFLLENPDIRNEFELFTQEDKMDLPISFPEKEKLKRIPMDKTEVSSDYFKQQCIAYVEGFMAEAEEKLFLDMVFEDKAKQMECKLFQKTVLTPENISFNEKLFLKREVELPEVSIDNFDWYCLAYIENILNHSERKSFEEFIEKNPELKPAFKRFQNTVLTPDFRVVFPLKKSIKKFVLINSQTKKYLKYAASAAAILIFGGMLYYSTQLNVNQELIGSLIQSNNINNETNQPIMPLVEEKAAINSTIPESKIIRNRMSNNYSISERKENEPDISLAVTSLEPMISINILKLNASFDESLSNQNKEIINVNKYEKQSSISADNTVSESKQVVKKIFLNKKVKNITQAGIAGINKLTNTELVIANEKDKKVTKIAFNSKYFAFTTSVKTKQSSY